tara:strand:- start:98 stop:550 length:453 start_codon:yes stop_codon:yes gene_type:complete
MTDTEFEYQYEGGCRCGGVAVTYSCNTEASATPVRSCGCEYCTPQEHAFVSTPEAMISVQVKHPSIIYSHRFGTYSAGFCHCAVCNELVFVSTEIDGETYAAVSLQALHLADEFTAAAAFDFEAETDAQRNARRQKSWTSKFSLTVANAD